MRKTIFFALTALMAFGKLFSVYAAGAGLSLQSCRIEGDRAVVYGAALPDVGNGNDKAEAGRFTARIGRDEAPVLNVSTIGETGESISYYCLADVSGSIKEEQLEQEKAVLLAIAEGLDGNDNMAIGALGTVVEETDFLSDKEELAHIIDGLIADREYTALYDAVIESISKMTSSKKCHQKKCLIILSDGEEETVIGKTGNEALKIIEDSRIPVYTVAMLRASYTSQEIACAENLGTLARQSAGGKDFVPAVGSLGARETGQAIVADNRNGLVLTLDISEVKPAADEILLSVGYETDTDTYNDVLYLYAADFPEEEREAEREEEKNTEDSGGDLLPDLPPEPSPSSDSPESQDSPPLPDSSPSPDPAVLKEPVPGYVMVLAAAAIILVIAVPAAVLLARRKKREEEEREEEREEDEKEELEEAAAAVHNVVISETGEDGGTDSRQERGERYREDDAGAEETHGTDAHQNTYEVKFMAVGYGDKIFTFSLTEDKIMTIGRNRKADLVLNAEDRHLSSVHCKVRCKGNVMNIWDMNSQNGTYVNGVPIKEMGMAMVYHGDIVRMGSYEYRVYIIKK